MAALFLFSAIPVWSQTEAVADEKPDPIIYFKYFERNNTIRSLEATIKTKVERTFYLSEGVTVTFYKTEVSPEHVIGTSKTNIKGLAVCNIPDRSEDEDLSVPVDYFVVIENDSLVNDGEETISVQESNFEMALEEEDSVRYVRMQLMALDENGEEVPVPDAEIQVFVKRLFGQLPIMEGTELTDEEGFLEVEFPAGIPGDTLGNLIVVAKILEHETFGNLEFVKEMQWGLPKVHDPVKVSRELWASRSNTPIYLLVIINTMIIGIWGIIFYIIYQVFKIRRIGKAKTSV